MHEITHLIYFPKSPKNTKFQRKSLSKSNCSTFWKSLTKKITFSLNFSFYLSHLYYSSIFNVFFLFFKWSHTLTIRYENMLRIVHKSNDFRTFFEVLENLSFNNSKIEFNENLLMRLGYSFFLEKTGKRPPF